MVIWCFSALNWPELFNIKIYYAVEFLVEVSSLSWSFVDGIGPYVVQKPAPKFRDLTRLKRIFDKD